MNLNELNDLLIPFGITAGNIDNVIDSSRNQNDYRLNIIFDKHYVLRINSSSSINEERISSLERLVARYNEHGIKAPHFCKVKDGKEYSYIKN
ncbi:MAG: hypothetical protein HUJ61_04065 [Bacilli bacterium]|nr:hypothetical protein [Bacilli bacterium]